MSKGMVIVEGKIKGKARPRMTKQGHTYTPNDTVTYENWVKLCYQNQDGRWLEGSIKAIIMIWFAIPKSYTKKRIKAIKEGLEYPQKKPDIDNVTKIILDSLNKIAYEDDSQVTDLEVMKRFTEGKERVEIILEVIDNE